MVNVRAGQMFPGDSHFPALKLCDARARETLRPCLTYLGGLGGSELEEVPEELLGCCPFVPAPAPHGGGGGLIPPLCEDEEGGGGGPPIPPAFDEPESPELRASEELGGEPAEPLPCGGGGGPSMLPEFEEPELAEPPAVSPLPEAVPGGPDGADEELLASLPPGAPCGGGPIGRVPQGGGGMEFGPPGPPGPPPMLFCAHACVAAVAINATSTVPPQPILPLRLAVPV